MGIEEIEILRERAEKFMENGEYLLSKGVLDIAAFNIQQSVELYLKYKLFQIAGDYPKTHSIKRLLKEIGKVTEKIEKVRSFMEENIDGISNLENAYITSHYIPTEFEIREVENMLKLAKKIRSFVDEL
ncbi:HEPN domain-containing protein [Archaeoglobus sp.]